MMGFVYKDFLLMRKQLLYVLFLMAVYAILVATGTFGPYLLSALVVILGLLYPMNAFAYDDLARWDKFAASTPAGRKGMVAGRYLFALLLLLASTAVASVLLLLFRLLRLADQPLAELLLSVLACAGVGLVMNAVILPLLYKFGVEKARMISMIVFAVVFGGCVALGFLMEKSAPPQLSGRSVGLVVVLVILLAAVGFYLSYRISQRICAHKEL